MKRIYNVLLVAICVHGLSNSQNLDLNTLRLAQRQAFKTSKTNSSILNKDKRQDRFVTDKVVDPCLLYTSPSPRDLSTSRMPSSA